MVHLQISTSKSDYTIMESRMKSKQGKGCKEVAMAYFAVISKCLNGLKKNHKETSIRTGLHQV
jgi:hypothetical protein